MNTTRKTIESIILIYPLLSMLQDGIEKEQDKVIEDTISPAEKVICKLIELDNRRIDLCNLSVLNGFIERGLGEKFEFFRACIFGGVDAGAELYSAAERQIECAGFSTERAADEFAYLFKALPRRKRKKETGLKVSGSAEQIGASANG